MSSPDSGWAWFGETSRTAPASAAPEPVDAGLVRAFARCFREPDGERVLRHLRAVTVERALGPTSPEAHLRHLEGQRQLVAYILALIERGRRGESPPPCRDTA